MKRTISLLLVLMLVLLAGCRSQFPEKLEQYTAPWDENVSKLAKQDNSIHYYFMSGKGMIADPNHTNYPEKWGDSCLIVFPDGKTMLVDTGLDTYAQVLVENLRRMGIKKLDYVLLSHPHSDHCFGLWGEDGILENFSVGKIYTNGAYNIEWENEQIIEELCKEKNIPLQVLKKGDELTFGDVQAQVLWPMENVAGQSYTSGHEYDVVEEINNTSIVIRFDYKKHSSLFTGDIFASGEEEILELYKERTDVLDADLLKAMHHGSQTSNTYAFVKMVEPEVAVSTGFAPIVGDVRDVYSRVESILLSDRNCGYIHVYSDGNTMQYDIGGLE